MIKNALTWATSMLALPTHELEALSYGRGGNDQNSVLVNAVKVDTITCETI